MGRGKGGAPKQQTMSQVDQKCHPLGGINKRGYGHSLRRSLVFSMQGPPVHSAPVLHLYVKFSLNRPTGPIQS